MDDIMGDSAITCDEIIEVDTEAKSNNEETKTFSKSFNEKNITYKTQNFYILLTFLLIITTLLIAASIYCYLIIYWAKGKHLLPFHSKNNKSKKPIYW